MNHTASPTLGELSGTDLGARAVSFEDTAAILYALAVGASSSDLDLVYERDLRVLPTFACALGLWAVEAAGQLGAYDPSRALHASQRLVMHDPLPVGSSIKMSGRIANVYDKGKAALIEIEASSSVFSATYGIFLPGLGGWGGDSGASARLDEPIDFTHETRFVTSPDLAALYRLTGDRHPVHIDPAVAEANNFARPILHGLCTLGIAMRIVALQTAVHPADLAELAVRLTAPVLPGDTLAVVSGEGGGVVQFGARVGETTVLSSGRARFA